MRTKLSVLAAVVALAIGGTAKADSISLIWQVSGTDTTQVSASATITANIILTVTNTNRNTIAWQISWDDELAYVVASTSGPVNSWLDNSGLFDNDSSGTSPGNQRIWAFAATSPTTNMALGTATVGTITFHVTGAVASDGAPGSVAGPGPGVGDVSADFVNTTGGVGCFITQGGYCTGGVTLVGASVDLVPEPGTLALLALGVTGLGLVGRRSRS